MAFSDRPSGPGPRRSWRSRGLPGPAVSGRLDTVRRDLGGHGCLDERGGTLVAGLLLRLRPRALCGPREPAVSGRAVGAAPEMGETCRSRAGRACGGDVIVPLRPDSTLRGILGT